MEGPKEVISASIDKDLKNELNSEDINISGLINHLLKRYFMHGTGNSQKSVLKTRLDMLQDQREQIKAEQARIESKIERLQDKIQRLEESQDAAQREIREAAESLMGQEFKPRFDRWIETRAKQIGCTKQDILDEMEEMGASLS